jgi:hypothetical protein
VRRIVDGIAYDTETATRIVGDNHQWSEAWWGLYRTNKGAFFKIVVDHDGDTFVEFKAMTDAEARSVLEKDANHLVEKYFGPMPEPGPMQFSRRTIIAAVEAMEDAISTHAALTRCLLKWSPELNTRCNEGTLADRFNLLIKFLDERPDFRLESGNLLADDVVEKAISLLPPNKTLVPWREASPPAPRTVAFERALDRDGFTIKDRTLRRSLPASMKLPEAEDEISRLLAKHGFTVAKGHLDEAFATHTDGLWAAANSQIRSFLEGLMDDIAVKLDQSAVNVPTGHARRAKLAGLKFLSRELNEWEDSGLGFVNGLMKRLHPHGSHPGLSDQEDSTFRLHTVLLAARLFLVRFDSWPTP